MSKIKHIFESDMTLVEVDEENAVIKNIAVLGQYSKNQREYPQKAMDSAVTVFEGKPGYVSHGWEHNVKSDLLGEWRNLRVDQSTNKVRADLHLLEKELWLMEVAKKFPTLPIGFSIHGEAVMEYNEEKGVDVIDHFVNGMSIDLVDKPGTVTNLQESESKKGDAPVTIDIKVMELTERLQVAVSEKLQLDEEKCSLANENKKLSEEIKVLTESQSKVMSELDELKVQIGIYEKSKKVDGLLSESKISPEYITPVFKKSLIRCSSDAEMNELIEERKMQVKKTMESLEFATTDPSYVDGTHRTNVQESICELLGLN